MDTPTATIDALNAEAWDLSLVNPTAAREVAQGSVQLATTAGYGPGKALALLNLAWCEYYLSQLDAAELAGTGALDAYSALNDPAGISMAFLVLGAVAQDRGQLDKALDRNMKAVELARAAGRPDREAAALNNVGEVLMDCDDVHEALEYFMRAAGAIKAVGQDGGQQGKPVELESNLFTNIGHAFIALGETGNAEGYLELGLSAAEAVSDTSSRLRALRGLAIAARRKGNREAARQLLVSALSPGAAIDQPRPSVELKIEYAVLDIEENRYQAAIDTLDELEPLAASRGLKPRLADIYRHRSLAYEASGNHREALADFKRFHGMRDSIAADRAARNLKDSEIRFELERARQEAEIFRLRNVELKENRAELERSIDRQRAVTEIGRALTASLDLGRVAKTVHESLAHLMDVTDFCLVLREERQALLTYTYFLVDGEELAPFSIAEDSEDSFAAYVVRTNAPVRIDDLDAEYQRYVRAVLTVQGKPNVSLIYAPLSITGKVIGAVGLQSYKPAAYSAEDLELIVSLGSFIAVAVENSRAHAELLRLNGELTAEKVSLQRLAAKVSRIANHDALTGLPNRLLLGELLDKALLQAQRLKKQVAVLFMDLDEFKPINDRYGHQAGDAALVEVARRLKDALRASDVVARVGGDEFIAVVTDMDDAQGARLVAGKLIDAFAAPLTVQGEAWRVGISIGIALYPEDGKSSDDLLRKADEAMYQIKRSGKNAFLFARQE